jgi:predicted nucleotide-binding protein
MPEGILDDLVRMARRCERAAKLFDREPVTSLVRRLYDAIDTVGNAASGSWVGYLAGVYLDGLRPARPGEFFDTEWGAVQIGSNRTTGGPWREYGYEEFTAETLSRAGVADLGPLREAAKEAEAAFEQAHSRSVPMLDALLATYGDAAHTELREKVRDLQSNVAPRDFAGLHAPRQSFTRDPRAQQGQLQAPHHVSFRSYVNHLVSFGHQAEEMARLLRHAVTYLETKHELQGKTVAKKDGKVFLGHGRSPVWKDLKDFLQDRLNVPWDEFNREPTAGLSTKERLQVMLDEACFAFLIMTAEDERADGTKHARENVIHEAGLFQGRLGFERAIILLEEGCSEFGNIAGLTQIRFPAANIMAKSEEIRRVLEREQII